MICQRCFQEIEADAPKGVTICGSCADDLRQEVEADIAAAAAESEAITIAQRQYEEEMDAELEREHAAREGEQLNGD